MINSERLVQSLKFFAWLGFLVLGALVVWFGMLSFLNPAERFPIYSEDYRLIIIFAILLISIALLALVLRGRFLIVAGIYSGISLLIIPILLSPSSAAILVTLWIGLVAYLLGDGFLDRWGLYRKMPSLDRLALSLVSGYGILMLLSTFLGFFGLYYPVSAWIILALPTILLLPLKIVRLLREAKLNAVETQPKSSDLRLAAWSFAIILVIGLGAYLWVLAPAVRWDDLSYHIPVPLNHIRNHAIVEMPESMQTYWAHYAETLYALGLLISPSTALPKLLHFSMGLLTTLLTFVLGRKLGGSIQGLLAAVVFWSLPIIQVEVSSAYIELFSAAMILAVLYACWSWVETQNDGALLLSGAFAGMAIGIKLNAVLLVALVWLFVLFKSVQNRPSAITVLKHALMFGIPAFLIAAPWLIRDWIWTGNPVFPSYNQIFKSPKVIEHINFTVLETTNRFFLFLRLPVDLLIKTPTYYHELPGFAFGGLSLFALPWLYPWFSQKQKRPVLITMALFCLLGIFLTFLLNPLFRYLIPVFPVVSILASENLVVLWEMLHHRWTRRIALFVGIVLGSAYLLTTYMATIPQHFQISERYPYRYMLGFETTDSFLERTLSFYDVYKFVERTEETPVKILVLGNDFRLYTNAEIHDPLFSKQAYDLLHQTPAGREFAEQLEDFGYTLLLVYVPEVEQRAWLYDTPVITNQFLNSYAYPIYTHNGMVLYRLVFDHNTNNGKEINLLNNPGFETLSTQELPTDWELSGPPFVSTDGSHAHSGKVAIQIEGPSASGAFQKSPVEANRIYTVGYWANPQEEGQVLQLFLKWLDEDGETLDESAEWADLASGWNHYQASYTAPSGAVYATLIVTTATPGFTWVDDVCLTITGGCP